MKLKIGALFAGYGGLDLAVESVIDAEVAWVSEVDAGPSRILAHRYPDVPNHGDVTQIDWTQVDPVDVITGGSPCQDLSHAGKRAGMKDGTRSGLWAAMCDAIETIRPRFVVWENVRGALSAEATAGDLESCEFCVGDPGEPPLRALGRVLGDLAELGYDAAWHGLRAADVGAPHGRWRVFVLAWPARDTARFGVEGLRAGGIGEPRAHAGEGLPLGAGPLPAWGSREWRDLTARLLPTPEAKLGSSGPDYARATRPGTGGDSLHEAVGRLMPTPRATDGTKGGPNQRGSSGDLMLPSAVTLLPTPSVADVDGGRKSRSGARSGELLLNGLASEQRFGDYAPAVARWEAVLGRPAPNPTEPTGRDGAQRLSARFVEWMMGLPDGWVTDPAIWQGMRATTARSAQLKALGNGVVPQQAAAALRWLLTIRARSLAEAA